MKHLIIGAGNMGKRYKAILETMGEYVESVDIEFKPETCKWGYDSVLVCTPPATHADLLALIPHHLPVFCEKPIIISLDQKVRPRTRSLVSCPWLFCWCLSSNWVSVFCQYPSNCAHRNLDLIHFVPFLENKFNIIKHNNLIGIDCDDIDIRINFGDEKYNSVDGNKIHKDGPCDMFEQMMAHWLKVVKDEEQSIMNFTLGVKLTRKLLEALDKKN